jgi:hypothetical protein
LNRATSVDSSSGPHKGQDFFKGQAGLHQVRQALVFPFLDFLVGGRAGGFAAGPLARPEPAQACQETAGEIQVVEKSVEITAEDPPIDPNRAGRPTVGQVIGQGAWPGPRLVSPMWIS